MALPLTATAQPIGPEFRVNTHSTDSQQFPLVASDANGNFIVVWHSENQDVNGFDIFGQRFSAACEASLQIQGDVHTQGSAIYDHIDEGGTMNRSCLITCFAGLLLVPVASVFASSALEGAATGATAEASTAWSDGNGVSLPAGVSAEWARAQDATRQVQHPNRAVAAPSRARPRWKAESDQAFASFGTSVGTTGDVNGDGCDDGIVGAEFYTHGQIHEGGAVVFRGRSTAATPR